MLAFDFSAVDTDEGSDSEMQGEGEDSEVWDDDSDDEASGSGVDNLGDKRFQLSAEGRSSSDALVRWLVMFLMSWQAAFNISHQAMQQLLKFLGRFFHVLAKVIFSPVLSYLASAFPASLFLTRKHLHLHDKFVTYAVCGR